MRGAGRDRGARAPTRVGPRVRPTPECEKQSFFVSPLSHSSLVFSFCASQKISPTSTHTHTPHAAPCRRCAGSGRLRRCAGECERERVWGGGVTCLALASQLLLRRAPAFAPRFLAFGTPVAPSLAVQSTNTFIHVRSGGSFGNAGARGGARAVGKDAAPMRARASGCHDTLPRRAPSAFAPTHHARARSPISACPVCD